MRGSQSKTGRPDWVSLGEENQREEEGLKMQKEGRRLEEQVKVVCPGGGAGHSRNLDFVEGCELGEKVPGKFPSFRLLQSLPFHSGQVFSRGRRLASNNAKLTLE